MKTDVVLTMDEYFDQCCIATKRVSPPAPDARHILITAGDNLDSGAEAHGCRCDRWGASVSRMRQIPARGRAERGSFWWGDRKEVNKMEYLIVLGVVATMALYTLIIARCLKAPEWQ